MNVKTNKLDNFPGEIVSSAPEANSVTFSDAEGVRLIVSVIRDDIIHFRYLTPLEEIDDFSYGVCQKFLSKQSAQTPTLDYSELKQAYLLRTSELECRIEKSNMRVRISDFSGQVLCEDELGFHWEVSYDGCGNIPKISKVNGYNCHYYGLGDKPTEMNMAGKRFRNWNTDTYAFAVDHDPLYKAIPFYTCLQAGVSYGIYFDNSFTTHFDFGAERSEATSFWSNGGQVSYYFINGPQMRRVCSSYAQLTGLPELPPLWALGYHQCKWSYYPESLVSEVAKKFREMKIPCDAIYLDIDYMDGFRCFTWDKERFPQPKKMIEDLRQQGFKTVVIIDPGIKVEKSYSIFKQGLDQDYFCRRVDGGHMRGKVWPGDCYFPDFTNPRVREWWAGLFQGLVDDGVAGVWNDMNEPAVMEVPSKTFPLDVLHDYDGHPCSHRKAHNVYGMQMVRATLDGLKKAAPERRQFVITRAAYAGTQRYSSTWTGDNIATWDHLKVANMQLQRMNISGMGFCGSDIGGFEEQPSPELYVRWMQLGVFHPLCRTHSSGQHGDQEPWVFGTEILDIVRNYIELRYQLLLYLYTAFYQYYTTGKPMLQALMTEDQHDEEIINQESDFMFGDHLLVCPVTDPLDVKIKQVILPSGIWYELFSNKSYEGNRNYCFNVGIENIPVFVRSGAVIPRLPVYQHTQQFLQSKEQELRLDVYHTDSLVDSQLYEDEYDGLAYQSNQYLLRRFTANGIQESRYVLSQRLSGELPSRFRTFKLRLIGFDRSITGVTLDHGESIDFQSDGEVITAIVPADFSELTVA